MIGTNAASSQTQTVTDATVQVGRVFESGGIDGLILYALLLAAFLLTLLGGLTIWGLLRSLKHKDDRCHEQAKLFAEASLEASEALKDVATAIASSASASITFQQSQAGMLERLEIALTRIEARK